MQFDKKDLLKIYTALEVVTHQTLAAGYDTTDDLKVLANRIRAELTEE